MDLNKALKSKQKERPVIEEFSDATPLLVAKNEDRKVLETLRIGIDAIQEKAIEDTKRTAQAEKQFKKPSFSGLEIKELCVQYDLKILSTQDYKGKIPQELARKVKEFVDENELSLTHLNFFILAPSENFNTNSKIQTDPIIFYCNKVAGGFYNSERIREDDTLVQVHSWSNNFSILRKYHVLWADKTRNSDMPNFLLLIIILVVGFVGFLAATSTGYFRTIFFVSSFIMGVLYFNLDFNIFKKYWNENH